MNMDFSEKELNIGSSLLYALLTYSVFIPLFLLDIWVEIYHHLGFFLLNIPLVEREHYIRIDRHLLPKLNLMEKLNCVYCGYANGLVHYVCEIAARTEQRWCAIQHKKYDQFIPPEHHQNFAPRTEFE